MAPLRGTRSYRTGPDYYEQLRYCAGDCGLDCLNGILISIKTNVLAWVKVSLYLASFVVGIILCISVGVLLRNFEGNCILFAQIVWDGTTIWPWSESACDFVLYMNMALAVVYAILMVVFNFVLLFPRAPQRAMIGNQSQYRLLNPKANVSGVDKWTVDYVLKGMNPVLLFSDTLVCMLMLCSASVLTAGTGQFCYYLEHSDAELGLSGLSMTCSSAQSLVQWERLRIISGRPFGVDGSNFFALLVTAIICSWILFALWTAQLVLQCSLCCRRCSCEVAEEKRKPDRAMLIAQRRSRMTTPSHTPGGRHTPVPLGQPMLPPPQHQPVFQTGQRPYQMPPPQGYQPYRMPPPQGYHGHPPRGMPPQQMQGYPGRPMQPRQGPSVTMKMPPHFKGESSA